MPAILGYLLGLFVALIIVTSNHQPTTAYDIDAAKAACADNRGLKQIDYRTVTCNNSAEFELGKLK